jgi:hypothetical protein
MLKTEEFGKKIRKIIKKEYLKLFGKEQFKDDKEFEALIKNKEKDIISIPNITDDKFDKTTPVKEFKEKNFGILLENEKRLVLDFEIFCFKWERYLLVDTQYIQINEINGWIIKCLSNPKVRIF